MNLLYALIVALLAIFAVAPLEYPGAFESHTGLSAVYNLITLDQNPLQFFNWAPTFGRAYDWFRTDGALPYWIAEIFHRVGFGYLDSIKLVYAFAWICSGLAIFALARRFFSEAGALLAATVYIYLPFHIATVYVRGAFAESVVWAIAPLALLSVVGSQSRVDSEHSTVKSKQSSIINRQYVLSILPFAVLFLTQSGLAILFALFTVCLVIALNWQKRNFSRGIAQIILGLGVGALLSVPAVLRHGARITPDGFSPNFIQPYQLFSSLWGFGPSPTTMETSQGTLILDQFPFQLGVVPIGLAIIAVALMWTQKGVRSDAGIPPTPLTKGGEAGIGVQVRAASMRRIITMFFISAFILMLLTFEIVAPIWRMLGIFASYPWQLLTFAGLALSFVAGSVIDQDARLSQPAMLAFFVALPVVATFGYLAPRYVDAAPTRPHIAIFGNNEIALLDYRIVGPLRHGATVRIETKWQALRAIDHDYTVFVHAVDETGKTWAQDDSKPQGGALPTIKWIPGQVVFDTYTIQIDVDGPREGYYLEFGMYLAANGQRAAIESGADQLILPRPGDPPPTISDQLPPTKTP